MITKGGTEMIMQDVLNSPTLELDDEQRKYLLALSGAALVLREKIDTAEEDYYTDHVKLTAEFLDIEDDMFEMLLELVNPYTLTL